jgi:multiple sugar transport system permease protein
MADITVERAAKAKAPDPSLAAGAKPKRARWLIYIPMVLLAFVFLFPIAFMISSSFKPDAQIFADLTNWRAFFPVGDVSMDNYTGVFDRVPALRFLLNSLFVTACIVGLGLIVNSMAGFALSRLEWGGRKIIFGVIIATLIIPFETIAIPMVFWVAHLPWIGFDGLRPVFEEGWLNSYRVQIVPFIAGAFSIFLFAQYFTTIPKELDEAARVDGCGWFRIYRSIVMPLSGPVIATSAILTFLPNWNQYLWPLMVVQEESKRPVMLGIAYFRQLAPAWGETMAYATMITIPVLLVFVAFQRNFVKSIASTGVKG